ncbi:MAG: protein-L-isoaspartate(D-aspartate) O-methyltransferase [Chloroflexaceae bacterium]|nr:protein-L-isoaspartate(D-aspartate) O-methyltransferase [Chloroflexaceae bacterium]
MKWPPENRLQKMIRTQLQRRGIGDRAVLHAMAAVPRHMFVPESIRAHAYEDRALPLIEGQTISQPFMVALMAQSLQLHGHERVLDVGTGSGYAAAVLSLLSAEVYSVERSEALAHEASGRLHALGYDNVKVIVGDGTQGMPEFAPFQGISVAASSPWVPLPLRQQLADGGRLVIPVGGREEQLLLRITRIDDTTRIEQLGGVRFVPLIGDHAWNN